MMHKEASSPGNRGRLNWELEDRLEYIRGPIHHELSSLNEANHGRSAVKASVGVATLNTGSSLRDKLLRSGDFFDVERFPKVTFHSSRVEEVGVRLFRVLGDLTIRDVTREVELDAAYDESIDESGSRRARFSATPALSRREFDLGRRGPIETAGFIASDRVTVTLDIRAVAA